MFFTWNLTNSTTFPSFTATGNGLLYSFTPTLTITPSALSTTYGNAAPSLANYVYSTSGYLGSDASADILTGSLNGSTSYTQGNNAGTYNVNYNSGSLSSAMGYALSYANNASALTVNKASITVSGITAQNKTYDGNTAASLVTSAATLAGRVGSDDLSVSATGSFDDRNIGRGKNITLSNLSLQGADASNYLLGASGQQKSTSADILQDSQSAAAIPTLPSSAFSKALPQGQLINSSCREKRYGLHKNKREDCLETVWIDPKLW